MPLRTDARTRMNTSLPCYCTCLAWQQCDTVTWTC